VTTTQAQGIRAYLTALIPLLIPAFVITWALGGNRWASWGVEAMEAKTPASTSFADLANITATADCIRAGSDITVCDPYGRPYQPYVVLPARTLSALGLGTDQTGTLGYALAALFVITVAALGLVLARNWRGSIATLAAAQAVLALAAVTPPAMLAIERGQIEILTFALALLALVLLNARGNAPRAIGASSAVLATWTKFFAIGLFAPFISRTTLRKRANWWALTGLLVGLGILLASWSDLQQAAAASRSDQPATSKSQFGTVTLISTFLTNSPVGYAPDADIAERWSTVRIIGWVVVAIGVVLAVVIIPRSVRSELESSPLIATLLLGSMGVLVLPYILGASHDYRLVFLLITLTAALVWLSGSRGAGRWLSGLVVVAVVIALITSASMVPMPSGFIWPKPALVLGDFCLLFLICFTAGLWIRQLVSTPVSEPDRTPAEGHPC
jgi:hypothetical protein